VVSDATCNTSRLIDWPLCSQLAQKVGLFNQYTLTERILAENEKHTRMAFLFLLALKFLTISN
jgi:hypothetical protein